MSLDENKAIAKRFIEEVFMAGRTDTIDELVTPDFAPRTWPGTEPGIDALRNAVTRVSSGLSDVRMDVEDVIAEGDKVVVRLTAHAVQVGDFMGMPASGRSYTIGEIHIFRIEGGKVAEHWHQADLLGMMRQLGAMGAT